MTGPHVPLSERRNSEILFSWLRIAIRNKYEAAFPALERSSHCKAGVSSCGQLRGPHEDRLGHADGESDLREALPLYHSRVDGNAGPDHQG